MEKRSGILVFYLLLIIAFIFDLSGWQVLIATKGTRTPFTSSLIPTNYLFSYLSAVSLSLFLSSSTFTCKVVRSLYFPIQKLFTCACEQLGPRNAMLNEIFTFQFNVTKKSAYCCTIICSCDEYKSHLYHYLQEFLLLTPFNEQPPACTKLSPG